MFPAGIGLYHRKSSANASARLRAIDATTIFVLAKQAFEAGASVPEVVKLYDLTREHAELIRGKSA